MDLIIQECIPYLLMFLCENMLELVQMVGMRKVHWQMEECHQYMEEI